MLKPSILTITGICLAGMLYAQKKKELTIPAFLAPVTVVQTISAPSDLPGQQEAPVPAKETKYTHTLQHRNPGTGVDLTWPTEKPIQVVGGEKIKEQPVVEAREKKSDLK